MFTVVIEFECPKSADTVATSTPALIKMEAWAWRKCAIQLGRTDDGTKAEWHKMETRRKFLKKAVFATLLTAVLIFFILF